MMFVLAILRLLFLLSIFVKGAITATFKFTPVVTLKSGKIRGVQYDLNTGDTVSKYLGIPFAKARRFEKPTEPDTWTGVKDMVSFGSICPQQSLKPEVIKTMSEDCLNLNVFVPKVASSNLPVMVWIHGGGFVFGSNKPYDASYIAGIAKIIVVAINYRLSVLGFLAVGRNTDLKGNYGMLDQVHALHWVKNNIAAFGGDPGKVTIFGESAGGASVSLLVLSPLTKGLFQRAIIQSGDANAIWAYRKYCEHAVDIAKAIAHDSGCKELRSLGQCLKAKTVKEVFEASERVLNIGEAVVRPVVDGHFLPDTPDVLLNNGQFHGVDVLMGFTDDEGTSLTDAIPGMETNIHVKNGMKRSDFIKIINHKDIKFVRGQNAVINEAILYRYTDWDNITDPRRNRRMFMDMAGDSMYVAPSVKSAKAIANKTSNIYVYELQYRLDTFENKPVPSWVRAFHASDLAFLFGEPLYRAALTNSSVYTINGNFSMNIIKLWTNFAKSGDPNKPEPIPLAWPKFDAKQEKFMALKPSFAIQEKPRNDHVAFWNEFVPAALKAMGIPSHCTDKPVSMATSLHYAGPVTLVLALLLPLNLVW